MLNHMGINVIKVSGFIYCLWIFLFGFGSIFHGVDPLSYFSFQPVLHDWCNKGRGMCYPVCGMVHIKVRLLLRQGFRVKNLNSFDFLECPIFATKCKQCSYL